MIIDKLENSHLYTFTNVNVAKAIDFIKQMDLNNLSDGRYEIVGDNAYALVNTYDTKDRESAFLESHKKYIDVQFVVRGTELLGYLPFEQQKIHKDYNEENDFMLFDEEPSFIRFSENMFAVLYPEDLHMPGIKFNNISKVKKIVIKARV
jgi:YhcH/YjgK/YiaL family protein